MEIFSKNYSEEDDGFEGNSEAYSVSTQKENLKNWLNKEVFDSGNLYEIIKNLTQEILIIKNINVSENFQGQGNGTTILCDLIQDSFASAAILICDVGESQREGFVLERFYEENGFKTILIQNDYPLMVYPEKLANQIIEQMQPQVIKNLKPF